MRPELYLPYLSSDFKFFKLKMLAIKNKGGVTKADFTFCTENIQNIDFKFATNEEHKREDIELLERRELATTIAGTQKLHSFKPVNSYSLEVRSFSASTETCIKKVAQNMQCIQNQDINGYVAVTYDKEWYVGYVMEKDNEKKEAKITFMQPKGPARSFTYRRTG